MLEGEAPKLMCPAPDTCPTFRCGSCAWYTIGIREAAEGRPSWIESDYILLRTQ